ncbi:FAD binding domain-containing protein [Veillonella magna]|uniref:FAD binding domain-containing protein n=1 Tax=Veillonella magna TaxID=464322 RepID=A0ABS2GJB0_9FIRM|nr:FAD binding domain-containing protein [Veillonella magna]MBM6825111.1 FAD binding domain-containing protein [Veillonella magna]MBM6913405.1 FAD binding domain-containing protein [Veillonella magna]
MIKYIKALSLDEMGSILQQATENTFYLAGGTDLVVGLRSTSLENLCLVDISAIEYLRSISEDESFIYIGATVTMTEMSKSALIKKYCPALAQAASVMGSVQVRNRATVGGNIMNAAQCSDTLPCLYAYDAVLSVLTSSGECYEKPIRELVTGICKTTIPKNEIVLHIKIRKRMTMSGFAKIGARKRVTISKLNGCILIEPEKQNNIVTIYLGAVGVKPTRATLLETCIEHEWKTMTGQRMTLNETIKRIAQAQIEEAIPTRSSKYYKRVAIFGLLDTIFEQLERVRI